jgi:hypothetical protein
MPLRNEGTDVWRPVEVTALEGAFYRVEGTMPPDEEWEFPPGTLVTCRWKKFSDGEHKLIPTGRAQLSTLALFADHFKRMAGLWVASAIAFIVIEWLPRAPEGHTQPLPLLVAGVGVSLSSVSALIWLKPRSLASKWALGSGLGFGVVLALASFPLGG